jgi:hypothetical protein
MKTGKIVSSLFALLLSITAASQVSAQSIDDVTLNTYKEETCGCCGGWMEHMDARGYHNITHHPADLNGMKEELGIKREWQSCHTAVTDAGFLFEGHVPEKFVTQFLASPPEGALGLAVPGMPLGTPGMDFSDAFTPYDVILMMKDGSSSVFASVKTKADQGI